MHPCLKGDGPQNINAIISKMFSFIAKYIQLGSVIYLVLISHSFPSISRFTAEGPFRKPAKTSDSDEQNYLVSLSSIDDTLIHAFFGPATVDTTTAPFQDPHCRCLTPMHASGPTFLEVLCQSIKNILLRTFLRPGSEILMLTPGISCILMIVFAIIGSFLALLTNCFILLHTCWGILFYDGLEKRCWFRLTFVLLSHMLVALLVSDSLVTPGGNFHK